MNRSWLLFILSFHLLVGAYCATATASETALPLTRLLVQVATVHPQIKARQMDILAAQSELEVAQWGRYPSLSSQISSSGSATPTAVYLQQPLWAGGRIDADIRRATAARQQSDAALLEAQQSLQLQASNAFFDALRYQERLRYAYVNEDEHRKLAALIGRRVEAEISPDADLVLARARMQQALTERVQAQRSLDGALTILRQLAGVAVTQLKSPQRVQWPGGMVDQWLERAVARSGEIQRLRLAVDVAQAQVELARSGLFPSLSWVHRRMLDNRTAGYPSVSSYLSLDYKPGAGLSAGAAAEAARAREQAAVQAIELQERQIEQLVRNSYAEMTALELQEPISHQLVQETGEIVASYLRQYQIGRKNWLDVLNALRESTQASYGAADIVMGLQSVRVRLMLLSGQISLQDMQAIHE